MKPKTEPSSPSPVPRSSLRSANRDCVRFELCVMRVKSEGWSGFSCVACKAYRPFTLDDFMEWFDPAAHPPAERRRLAAALLETIKRPTKRHVSLKQR